MVEKGELGLPGVTVQLISSSGKVIQTTPSAADGSIVFKGVPPGTYQAGDLGGHVRETVGRRSPGSARS